MRITESQLRQIIREELKIHIAPENLVDMGPEEAYGLGWEAGRLSTTPVEREQAIQDDNPIGYI